MTSDIVGPSARRYRPKRRGRPVFVGVVALVDLFFLLLFFILMASSLVRISGIKVDLPRAKAPQASGLGGAIVTIAPPATPDGPCRIYYRDRELSGNQLRNELLTSPPLEKVLIIRADRKVPTGVLSGVMAIAESANMETFIAVSAPESGREMRFE